MRAPFILALLVSSVALAGCVDDLGEAPELAAGQAAIGTEFGWIVIEFYCAAAPVTVANFRDYAADGFYEDTVFHRIMKDFMIQGGGFDTSGERKETKDPIPLEFEIANTRGTVAMARTSDPNSATSQFFINTVDNTQNLGPSQFGPGYTVFARVVDGMDVVDEIAGVEVRQRGQEKSDPVDPPVIERVELGEPCPAIEPTWSVIGGSIQNTKDGDVWETTVSAATDIMPLWFMNTGNQDDTYSLSVLSPSHWDASLAPGTLSLPAYKPTGPAYPYTQTVILTLKFQGGEDQDVTEDRITVKIQSDTQANVSHEVVIAPVLDTPFADNVTRAGDGVVMDYVGTFDNEEQFDAGTLGGDDFPITVAGGGLVTGFSMGMLGMRQGETLDIRFPPEIGYGYGTSGHLADFDGEWLNFRLTFVEYS